MAKLIHKNKIILENMKYAISTFEISRGLMFARMNRIKKGICLVMPTNKDVKFGASVTMLFVFYPLEILFINSKFEIVDKQILRPWVPSYTPIAECMYVVEGKVGTFEKLKINDKVKFEFEDNDKNFIKNQNTKSKFKSRTKYGLKSIRGFVLERENKKIKKIKKQKGKKGIKEN